MLENNDQLNRLSSLIFPDGKYAIFDNNAQSGIFWYQPQFLIKNFFLDKLRNFGKPQFRLPIHANFVVALEILRLPSTDQFAIRNGTSKTYDYTSQFSGSAPISQPIYAAMCAYYPAGGKYLIAVHFFSSLPLT